MRNCELFIASGALPHRMLPFASLSDAEQRSSADRLDTDVEALAVTPMRPPSLLAAKSCCRRTNREIERERQGLQPQQKKLIAEIKVVLARTDGYPISMCTDYRS